MAVKAVPQIERNPRTVSQTAAHYGYVAFHDITLGPDHRVQPADSPYRQVLPCRELIPFTNIEVGEIDEKQVQNGKRKKYQPPVKIKQKTAFECATEMENSYADWAFQILRPLTGFTSSRAFHIFQTIQPFHYKLKDLQEALFEAGSRIDQTVLYEVSYEGETNSLYPLSDEDKEIAREVLGLIQVSANQAIDIAVQKQQATITSMTSRFAGGDGKAVPDPLDKIMAEEFDIDLPQLVAVQKSKAEAETQKKQVEDAELRRRDIELREKEIALKERELDLREQEQTPTDQASEKRGPGRPPKEKNDGQ